MKDAFSSVAEAQAQGQGLFEESMPMIWLSRLVYQFAALVDLARSPESAISIPAEILEEYRDQRLDVRNRSGGHGLSFDRIYDQFVGQADELKKAKVVNDYDLTVVERMKAIEDGKPGDGLFLEVFDSLHNKYECVYGVFKDEFNKRIIVAFRGSTTRNDWLMNLSAQLTDMQTPPELRGKLDGELNEHVKVHRGFYEYIFDNEAQKGQQVYDKIVADIKPFVEKGYVICVTGHSLGAAMSSLLAFKLAGSKEDWVPKPISCISLASPFVGGSGFRTAFQQLERDGLLRYLRITNSRDSVPTIPPFAPSIFHSGRYFHVGMHLTFNDWGGYSISYPQKANGIGRALRSALILKPLWSTLKYHAIDLVDERMTLYRDELDNKTINGLYNDKGIVGHEFNREDFCCF